MHLCQGNISGALSKAFAFGGAGVHVFILCSGLGLYLSYLRKPLGYKDFLRKRFTKVYLPYVIAVALWGTWLMINKGAFPMKEVMSHLLLYKMFSVELDTSLCYPYWFISTIIQFYLAWPLIVRLVQGWGGHFLPFAISIAWGTLVGVLCYEEMRPWGSFFLQYLWEFCLGMWIAERIFKGRQNLVDVKEMKWWWLLVGSIGGMGLSALMAWNGGWLKLYNDIPSLVGYLSMALLIYKIGIKFVNRFFEWANSFSYELYLVHSLVFTIVAYIVAERMPSLFLFTVSIFAAYLFAYIYRKFTKKISLI